MSMPTNQEIIAETLRFIETPVAADSRGGWPEYTSDDIQQLQKIINMIIDAKFPTDCDGCQGVSARVGARGLTELVSCYIPPRPDFDASAEVILAYLRDLESTRNIVGSQLRPRDTETFIRIIQDRMAEA